MVPWKMKELGNLLTRSIGQRKYKIKCNSIRSTILFIKGKDGSIRLCINYGGLKGAIVQE